MRALAPAVIPLMLAALAFGWSIASTQRRTRVGRLGRPLLLATLVLLVTGEVLNGIWKGPGFHAPTFGLGVALAVGGVLLYRLRGRPGLRRMIDRTVAVVREDFHDGHPAIPLATGGTLALLLGACALWCAIALSAGILDNWMLFLNHRYLHLLTEASRLGSLWARMRFEVCADPLTATPFGFALVPFASGLDGAVPILLLRVAVGLGVVLLAVSTRLGELGRRAVGGAFLMALMASSPQYAFNRSAVFEPFFAGLFLVNLLMVLRLRRRPGFLLLLGFIMGFTLVHKETTLLLLVLTAWTLAREQAAPRDAGRLIGAWLGGLLLGMLPLIVENVRCHTAEGMSLLPYLGFRGAQLKQALTQPMVQTIPAGELTRDLGEILLARLSFQTLGEVAAGAAITLGPVVLTGAFPILYLLVNGPRERARRLGMLLGLCVPMFGLLYWKGGDSAEALQFLLPFGAVYAVPFWIRLGRTWIETWRNGRWRRPRALYLHLLVAFNVLWMGGLLLSTTRVLSDLPDVAAWARSRDDPGPAGPLIEQVLDLRRQGALDSILVCEDCLGSRSTTLLRLAEAGVFVVHADVRYTVFNRLEQGRNQVLEQTLRLLPHQQTMDMRLEGSRPPAPLRAREHLLVHGWSKRMNGFLQSRAKTLGRCIEVLSVHPAEPLALLRLHREACLELATMDGVLPTDDAIAPDPPHRHTR